MKQEGKQSLLFNLLRDFVWVSVSLLSVSYFVGFPNITLGNSMEPTLHHLDFNIVWTWNYTPQQFDVISFQKADAENPDRPAYAKRIIALEGQRVVLDYDNHCVWVDGIRLEEPYLEGTEPMEDSPYFGSNQEILVPEGEVFVLGDNRNHSEDSRFPDLGTIDTRYIQGELQVLFSFGALF